MAGSFFCQLCAGVVALGLASFLSACSGESATGDEGLARSAKAASLPATSGTSWGAADAINAQCLVLSQRAVKLKAEVGGRVDAVEVALGQAVERGQLLARINTQAQALDLERLRLSEQQSRVRAELLAAQVQQAEAAWQALQPLYAERAAGTLPREALNLRERQAELQLAKIALSDTQLQALNLERVLRQAEIRSPMRGVVLARNAEVGMVVAPGVSGFNGSDVLFEIGDPDRLRAQCSARESDASRLFAKQDLTLVLDGMRERQLKLQITQVAPAIVNESGSSSLPFWVDFDRPSDLSVLAGMHGSATVHFAAAASKQAPAPGPGSAVSPSSTAAVSAPQP
jgi:RND family efflux transporter MFP subunit